LKTVIAGLAASNVTRVLRRVAGLATFMGRV
jgi:hypothetical protein